MEVNKQYPVYIKTGYYVKVKWKFKNLRRYEILFLSRVLVKIQSISKLSNPGIVAS